MAQDTPHSLRATVIYQIFTRNHSPAGTFAEVTADLDRIKDLGVDVVYLLPIHPVGVVGRKGGAGSPYAISDYRAINPDLGTTEDFVELVDAVHERGMRIIIDVVFNHTSPDSMLVRDHPEFFHRDDEGRPTTTVPAWHDIIDLKHPNPDLNRYLIDSLRMWVELGVDGFRCDVANLVPLSLWRQARAELAEAKPGLLWLAESPHPSWVAQRRRSGLATHSDGEMFEAFDILYDSDMWSLWQGAVTGQVSIAKYVEGLRWQEASLPAGHHKLRYVENHDNFRIMRIARSRGQALAWSAWAAFNSGPLMIYAGQESGLAEWPSLFEREPVQWGERELTDFVSRLTALNKRPERLEHLIFTSVSPVLQAIWGDPGPQVGTPHFDAGLFGMFNLEGAGGCVAVPLADGVYPDLLGGADVEVRESTAAIPESAVVVAFDQRVSPTIPHSDWLDIFLSAEDIEPLLSAEDRP